jgi:surfactin synthase thioesterase subunit
VGLEYPGHGRRMSEAFARSVADLTIDLMPDVQRVRGGIGLFGHSLGAVVAFELGLALQAIGEADIVGLVVSGCSAPGSWAPATELELSDELLHSLVSAGGGGAELFAEEELRELFLPMLRADMEIAGRYRGEFGGKAEFPVLALCGDRDPIAPPRAMDGWRDLTTDFSGVHTIEGGHFFPQERHEEVGAAIRPLFSKPHEAHGADA